ncbi:hypothetical protein [Nocardia farcinica]|uniref:hypothetical protein n=1 Tax=Nocardia farcinica TaxID=37329 RepID=UPI002454EB4B|nr:hypothetical protein [Nocardia farcinica]
MGMYTEFFFRARIRKDAPPGLLDWLNQLANNPNAEMEPYDGHPFFACDHWESVLIGRMAAYQISQPIQFRRCGENGVGRHELIVHSSSNSHGSEIEAFVGWIAPFVDALPGTFLGYSLYEDSRPDGWHDTSPNRERPGLIFMSDPMPTTETGPKA